MPSRLLLFLSLAVGLSAQPARLEFRWPTPNHAWEQGRPIEDYIQPTISGDPESGTFGCIRSGGGQFHEGIDIKAISRDRTGEPADPVSAAMAGVVRYVNPHPGNSNYGRYIVIEHPDLVPAVYTLYAHLARIETGVRPGVTVRAGDVIALMGRSEGSLAIPKERAHVHFEIGLRLTDSFDGWYHRRGFGSPNDHGIWNGMNLMGFDPLDFLRQWRTHRVADFQQYFDQRKAVVRVRIASSRVPDFITRYPSLLRRPMTSNLMLVAGWELECDSTGLPFGWTPLTLAELGGQRDGTVRIVAADQATLRAWRCKSLVRERRGGLEPGSDLETVLQLLFGFR
ncbi:MAG TPA: M23 family metallopeptidase [Candidatus Didemnitutus sp.]|nr:M23 family metallopeptidase [Candidatus Didemnitutus sp.]